jgi:hypothetical protein
MYIKKWRSWRRRKQKNIWKFSFRRIQHIVRVVFLTIPLSLILHNILFSFDSPLCRPPHFGNLSIRRRKKKEKIRHMSISSYLSFFYYYYYFLCPPCPLTFFEMKTKYKIKKFCPYKKNKFNKNRNMWISFFLTHSIFEFLGGDASNE